MTTTYIVTAFLIGLYIGGQLVAWHIKREFRKIDRDVITVVAGEDLNEGDPVTFSRGGAIMAAEIGYTPADGKVSQ